MPSESAERRARRKLLAEAYGRLPSRETLQTATELERAKMQRSIQNEQFALQRGSLAVAVLSQVPRDNEENRPLFTEARNVLLEVLKRGVAQLLQEGSDEDLDVTWTTRRPRRDRNPLAVAVRARSRRTLCRGVNLHVFGQTLLTNFGTFFCRARMIALTSS
jgi:hypothetical protein